MELLFVTPRPPGPCDLRTFHLLSALAQRGHTVTLVCGATPSDAPALRRLQPLCAQIHPVPLPRWNALSAPFSAASQALPLAAAAGLNPQFAHTLRRVVDQQPFQAAHLTGLASVPLRAALIGIPAVLDVPELASHALHSGQGLAALTTLLDLGRTRRYVAHLGQHVERLIVRNATDAWALRTLAGTLSNGRTAPIHVLSDGVDLAAFTPQPIVREPTRLVVSDIPAAHAEQVAHFIAQVLLQVWQTRTDVQLTLAGIALTPTVRRLGRDSRITLLPHGSDPRPALAQATLACVPPFPSASLPTAALHALAMGTPLLAAASTIPQPGPTDGHDLLLANSAAQYAAQIIALLDDHRYRGRLGRAGRQYVAQHHAWADRAAQLEQIYAAAAGAEIADWRLDLGLYQLRAERW